MSPSTTYELAKQIAALNRHDADAFAAFYAQDATIADPQYLEPLRGHAAIRKDIGEFLRAFPDLVFTVETSIEHGNTIAFEGVAKGTNKGPLATPAGDVPATNKPLSMRFAAFFQVNAQGLVTSERRYYDLAGMLQQLGVSGQ